MAKGKRHYKKPRNSPDSEGVDDDRDINDASSTISNVSSTSAYEDILEETEGSTEEEIEETSIDEFESILKDNIEMTFQKSTKSRTKALLNICSALRKKVAAEFIVNRWVTLIDICDKCLKKGSPMEQIAAAQLSSLIVIQVGGEMDCHGIIEQIEPIMKILLQDNSIVESVRAEIASSLGLISFLTREALDNKEITEILEKTFKDSLKTNKTILTLNAFHSWTLLMATMPHVMAMNFLKNNVITLSKFLNNSDVDLRMSCGEGVAVLYESAIELDEKVADGYIQPLMEDFEKLAHDSNKYRSKKDRKEQRSIFRDLISFLKDGHGYSKMIKFNSTEYFTIESWNEKQHYDVLSQILSTGLKLHLTENAFIREIFDLGQPLLDGQKPLTSKKSKDAMKFMNKFAEKSRYQVRNKGRDNKSLLRNDVD